MSRLGAAMDAIEIEQARQLLISACRNELIIWSPQGWRPKLKDPQSMGSGVRGVRIVHAPLGPYWADLIEILITEGVLIHPRGVYPSAAFRPLTVDEERIASKLVVTRAPTQGALHE